MKKIVVSLIAATLLTTSAFAKDECPSTIDKIAFGAIGVAQGFIIGGPIGAFWGLGMIAYSNEVNCNKKEIDDNSTVDNKLDEVKSSIKTEVKTNTKKYIDSFVNFDFNKYNINGVNIDVNSLNLSQALFVSIEGHTDSKGSDEYNFALGLKRAYSVQNYLIKQGVDKSKMSAVSFGETTPISSNDEENRRVDLKITYK